MIRLVGLSNNLFFSDECPNCHRIDCCLMELDEANKTGRRYFDCCGSFSSYFDDEEDNGSEDGYVEHQLGDEFTGQLVNYVPSDLPNTDGMW